MTMIVVAGIGVIINTATALMFASGRHGDLNIRAAFLHMAADALLSLGVVIGGIGILMYGWQWLDPVISLIIVAAIVWGTWDLLRESLDLATDAVPRSIDPCRGLGLARRTARRDAHPRSAYLGDEHH
jgi:cobalt-zinc-cadmium efflux system protein